MKTLLTSVVATIMAVVMTVSPQAAAPAVAQSPDGSPPISPSGETAFPLAQGAYWTYQGNVTWAQDGQTVQKDITWKMEVKEVVRQGQVTGYLVNGLPSDLAFYAEGDQPVDHVIIQVGPSLYYETGTDTLERLKDQNDELVGLVDDSQLMLVFPLQVGEVFGETMQVTRVDGMYVWKVSGETPADLTSVAGAPSGGQPDQYALEFATLSDHQELTFVPGLGITGYSYQHFGTEAGADVTLVEYHAGSVGTESDQVVFAGQNDNGGSLELSIGQVLELTLDGNPTTGFEWQPQLTAGGALEQQGDYEFTPSSDAIGAGGQIVFHFVAVAPGDVQLHMVYHQPWDTGTPPAETFDRRRHGGPGDTPS